MSLKRDAPRAGGLADKARDVCPEIGTVVRDRRSILVTLRGELDAVAVPQLGVALAAMVDGDLDRMIFDLDAVTFIDSSALAVLVRLLDLLGGRPGSVVVRHPSAEVRKVLDVTGLGAVLSEP